MYNSSALRSHYPMQLNTSRTLNNQTGDEEQRRSFDRELTFMPADYLRRVSPERMNRHVGLIMSHPGYPLKTFVQNPVSIDMVRSGNTDRLVTFSMNSPRSLVHVTAAIALSGGSIQSADLYPRTDGTLVIEVEFHAAPGSDGRTLSEMAAKQFHARIGEAPTPVCEPVRDLELHTRNETATGLSIIELRALDTRGLLYRTARAFAMLGVKIVRCDIRTTNGRAYDTFIVTDRLGRPLDFERELGFLKREILSDAF